MSHKSQRQTKVDFNLDNLFLYFTITNCESFILWKNPKNEHFWESLQISFLTSQLFLIYTKKWIENHWLSNYLPWKLVMAFRNNEKLSSHSCKKTLRDQTQDKVRNIMLYSFEAFPRLYNSLSVRFRAPKFLPIKSNLIFSSLLVPSFSINPKTQSH